MPKAPKWLNCFSPSSFVAVLSHTTYISCSSLGVMVYTVPTMSAIMHLQYILTHHLYSFFHYLCSMGETCVQRGYFLVYQLKKEKKGEKLARCMLALS